jgi:uroporphyrin-3 C-methyltransferase
MSEQRDADDAMTAVDDDTASMPVLEGELPPRGEAPRRGSVLSLVAVVAALAALAVSGVVLWQYRQFYVSLADADDQAQVELEQVRAAARRSEANLEDLVRDVSGTAVELRDLNARLDTLPGQFADLQQRIDAIQGGSFDVRSQWLEAEAQYYLSVANAELGLGGRWNNALTALQLAEDRLRESGDPSLASVRAQLADDILALESVRLVDVEGLAHSLSRLGARTAQLPIRSAAQAGDSSTADESAQEPGLGRLWSGIRDAFTSIVRVERRDEPAIAALTAEEIRLIRRQLSVELQSARLALVSSEAEVFRASLESAAAMLRMDFDTEASEVEGGLRLIESLLELDVAPQPPDISRSLYALRARGER